MMRVTDGRHSLDQGIEAAKRGQDAFPELHAQEGFFRSEGTFFPAAAGSALCLDNCC